MGGRCSEVEEERRAQPDAGDMSEGGRPPPLARESYAVTTMKKTKVRDLSIGVARRP